MDKALVITTQKEDKVKKQLLKSIEKKRKVLEVWMEKVETLKMELELIKNEYTVRIGYLLLKDNQLDLEIIQHKNLKKLMDEGMTYEEAVKAEEDAFYNEILRMQKEQEKIEEEKSFFEKRQEVTQDIQDTVKEVWKRLIRKFHPDLVSDIEEKQKRERLMKEINNAYATADLSLLQELENNSISVQAEDATKETLEMVLIQTENNIENAKNEFTSLRESEWYVWKKRIDKTKKLSSKEDVFADLEKNLLDDVVRKITILQELRKEVNLQNFA